MAGNGSGDGAHAHSVLIVEDVDDLREAMGYILRMVGFTVATAWSGEDALRHFREGFRPCAVTVDLRMPGMSGWQLWERMQADPELRSLVLL